MSAPQSLSELIRVRARHQPQAELFIGRPRHRTWADFDARTNRGAAVLRGMGLQPGARAGILAANCPEWI